ncbi:MAG: hypothetical protein U9Q83_02205 [Bacteroidota bacterium]|nr:hypothetical protein [Bacteroidota bacterium]
MEEKYKKEIIDLLRVRLSDLITMYERTKEENLHLFKKNQELIEKNNQKDNEINKLKERLETYKLSNAFIITSEGGDISNKKHDAKIRINRIVKEIDRCMALLNR